MKNLKVKISFNGEEMNGEIKKRDWRRTFISYVLHPLHPEKWTYLKVVNLQHKDYKNYDFVRVNPKDIDWNYLIFEVGFNNTLPKLKKILKKDKKHF